jgi:hypothetical protein
LARKQNIELKRLRKNASNRAYRLRNIEKCRERANEWSKNNPEARRNNRAEYREIVISFIRLRDGDNCGLCGLPVAYDDLSIDHIVDVHKGGKHEHDNVQLAHLSCNTNKKRGTLKSYRLKDRCRNNHDLSLSENIYIRPCNGCRTCLICKREYSRNYARNKAAGGIIG